MARHAALVLAIALLVALFAATAVSAVQPPNLPLPTADDVAAAIKAARANTGPADRAVAAAAADAAKTAPAPSSRAETAAKVDENALAAKGAAAVAASVEPPVADVAAAPAAAPPTTPKPRPPPPAPSAALAADPAAPTKSRLHQLQFLGTERSYHEGLAGAEAFLTSPDGVAALAAAGRPAGVDAAAAALTLPPLATQAGALGVRAFHFDAWADPKGGAYAGWAAPKLGGAPGTRTAAAWVAPGFKVFADPDFDARTHCVSLSACLSELATWSAANPNHSPITVFVSARDATLLAATTPARGNATIGSLLARMSLTPGPAALAVPPTVDAAVLKALDAEVAAAFAPPAHASPEQGGAEDAVGGVLLTPDGLRTAAALAPDTPLGRGVLARGGGGWPHVSKLRGRVMVVLAPGPDGSHAAAYAAAFPGLRGASLFTAAPSADAAGPDDLFIDLAGWAPGEAAPVPAKGIAPTITAAARRGFLVRSPPAAAADALAAGATYVLVDRLDAGKKATPLPVPRGVKGGVTASRCNPTTSLNPDSADVAALGCGQLVAGPDAGPALSDGGAVTASSMLAGGGAAPADPTANTRIRGVPTVASGFGRRRLARAVTGGGAIAAGGDEEDEDDGKVAAKSVTIEDEVEAPPAPRRRAARPAEVKPAASVSADLGADGAGTVSVASLPPPDPDANTFDGDLYALAVPSLLP